MNNTNIPTETWVVIHAPERLPSPFAAWRYRDGGTYGYALDGMTYDLVRKQLPPGGIRRPRVAGDDAVILEFWDYWGVQESSLDGIVRTSDHPFVPVIGESYELHYGQVTIGDRSGYATAQIRADGFDSSQWIDLDTGAPLEPAFRAFVVLGYKPI
ncbi:hypothetical protein [Burkholderia contaminans]|uniref:Uncharacterized protein n=1 Tax=Burkholderia contaminans TaxID=488447 RepID=A0A6P3BRZ8_9BURK|nr:hypothetical protein [Burkholderia contaminans]VWD62340.1 hypothetical protein BCO71033_06745 [Burkholderia contaminans]